MTAQTWRQQWRLFIRFCARPYLAPRRRHIHPRAGWVQDWLPDIGWRDLLKWATALWLLNMFLFGPLVIGVAQSAGATHAVSPTQLPWLLALVWAPLVEEMLFRFGLRRPAIALWLVPLMIMALWNGPGLVQGLLFALGLYLIYRSTRSTSVPAPGARRWLKRYRNHFWWIFHASTLLFAALHIKNFTFEAFEWWMLPILVLPQWITGLVLGWMRVMHGIGAAILLHALFNFGPLLLVWTTVQLVPSDMLP
ncbi:CPBP family glutamic-type intramembrane protease [Orrella marina]|uniref:CPBP family intramembrane metalloprotease n=1 Tax=Orrella marina TaxID=2163011 RepID=A0A2R4XKQ2_9BURK|nr:CPBP family glutamic-type intramembrane protease [Orrella marina]AWB34344.1 CPBP family intramembrane metalloprotease [Orrella marina]